MPSHRNNYSSRSRIQAFTGPGNRLGGRGNRGRSWLSRVANLAGAGATLAIPAAVAKARSMLNASAKKRKRSTDTENVEPMGISGPGSQHNFVFTGRKMQWNKNYGAPLVYSPNVGTSISCLEGLQEYGVVARLYDVAHTTAMWQFAGSGSTTLERVLYHQYVDCSVQIANSTAQPLYVTIYQIEPRKDTNATNVNDPFLTISTTLADVSTSGAAGTASNYKVIGTSPQSIEGFNQYWRIVDQQDLLMEGGQVHLERIKFAPNRRLDSELLKYETVNKDFNRFVLVRVSGTPEWATAAPTSVSTTKGRVSVVASYNYHYRIVEQSIVQYQPSNTLSGGLTNPLFEEHYVEVAGVPTA